MTTTIPMTDDMRTRNLYTQNVIVPQTSLEFKYIASKYIIKSRPYLHRVYILSGQLYLFPFDFYKIVYCSMFKASCISVFELSISRA